VSDVLVLSDEVNAAIADGRAIVALETTLVSHGFPHPEGADVARTSEARVRAEGAVPATIGVVDGQIRVGLSDDELERFSAAGTGARKLGPRDIAACVAQGALGATTVGSTLAIAALAGIRFMATGGLGGVHRGFAQQPDISADLAELTRSPVLIVSSGVKSLLDVPATAEVLESLSIPVLGWRTDTLPLFYVAEGGPPVASRVESVQEAATIARLHWTGLHRGSAVLLGRPPTESLADVEALIDEALDAAAREGVSGQGVTPFVLGYLHENSEGRTAAANKALIVDNATLAAQVAVAYTAG
jgi:pseudouridine-5'-phosphate glycosidase